MDNFSVIASFVLFGLFLIARPAEGFVVGYIDLADQRLQSSLYKRQEEPRMTDLQNRKYEIDDSPDGGLFNIYASDDNPPYSGKEMIFKQPDKDVEGHNELTEEQNGGTSEAVERKRDGENIFPTNEKQATHTNTQPTENQNQLTEQGTVTLVVVQLPTSRKED